MRDGYIDGRRQETGPLKIGRDWTGFFFRGDEAIGTANTLRMLAERLDDPAVRAGAVIFLRNLASQLEECRDYEAVQPAETAA